MKRLAALLAASTIVCIALPAWAASVTISDNFYSPRSVTIDAGESITWSYSGTSQHTVTADDGSFSSGTLTAVNGSYSHAFATAGTFPYHCNIHGTSMSGTVVVRAAASPSPSHSPSPKKSPKASVRPTPSKSASPSPTPTVSARPSPSRTAAARTASARPSPRISTLAAAPTDSGSLSNGALLGIVAGALAVMALAIAYGARRAARGR